jgi:hypothetical protein
MIKKSKLCYQDTSAGKKHPADDHQRSFKN